jgi:hypothetical protein
VEPAEINELEGVSTKRTVDSTNCTDVSTLCPDVSTKHTEGEYKTSLPHSTECPLYIDKEPFKNIKDVVVEETEDKEEGQQQSDNILLEKFATSSKAELLEMWFGIPQPQRSLVEEPPTEATKPVNGNYLSRVDEYLKTINNPSDNTQH